MSDNKKYDWKWRLVLLIGPFIFYVVVNMIFRTCRVTIIGKEHEDQFLRKNKPILFVSWHQALLYYVYHFRNRNGLIMVSQSNDGDLISRILKLFGFQSVRGSSSKGGKEALHQMIQQINQTQCSGGLVADAPKGPFGVAKIGIIKIAKETGLPLIPVMCWANKKKIFNSWDRTLLPLPFSRIVFFYAPPIYVQKDIDYELMEKMRVDLTKQLNQMHAEATSYFSN
jgi:lysophospholipid acyltransferase (LPLAT)-like uncharacterized protein